MKTNKLLFTVLMLVLLAGVATALQVGSAKIGDDIYDVITDGEFINKNEQIIVTEIKGNNIVVVRSSDNDQ